MGFLKTEAFRYGSRFFAGKQNKTNRSGESFRNCRIYSSVGRVVRASKQGQILSNVWLFWREFLKKVEETIESSVEEEKSRIYIPLTSTVLNWLAMNVLKAPGKASKPFPTQTF